MILVTFIANRIYASVLHKSGSDLVISYDRTIKKKNTLVIVIH